MLSSSKLRMFASQGAFVNYLQLNIYKSPIYIVFFPSSCGVVFYMIILHCTSTGQFQKSAKQEGGGGGQGHTFLKSPLEF